MLFRSELAQLQQQFPAVQVVGQVCLGEGVQLLGEAGQSIAQSRSGYQHFE